MINKTALNKNYEEIISSFGEEKYYGRVHSLETPCEGMCSFYYVELKPPYPKAPAVQFATLWKTLELHESQVNYPNENNAKRKKILENQFQCAIDGWNPRDINKTDGLRAKEIMHECQSTFLDGSIKKGWLKRRQVGYYLNNKFQGSVFSLELEKIISSTKNTGIVVYDDWDIFTILIEKKGVFSMFSWVTYA